MEQKKDNKNLIIYLLIAGLLGAFGYIWYSKTDEKETDKKQEATIAQKISENTDLNALYEESVARIDSITSKNTSLNDEILNKDGAIGKLKMDIENLLAEKKRTGSLSDGKRKELEAKIVELDKVIRDYEDKLAKLEAENKALSEENTTVKTNLQQTQTELSTTQGTLQQTQTEKTKLEEKVDVGQTLTAVNFSIAGIDEKRGGKEKSTSTAKRVDKLRIGFDLAENRIATSGKKEIFVCITAPDGTPVTVEALGSGTFNTREEGSKFFTNKIDVDYNQGQRKSISFDWKQNSDFQRGDYRVEVYQNGFKIGQGTVTLKKGGLFG